jgi:hypothetical protein
MSHLIVNTALKIIDPHPANLLIAQLPVVNSSNSKLYFEDNNAPYVSYKQRISCFS